MDPKKIGKAFLYPPLWLMILLVPISATFLIWAMLSFETESVIAIISYVFASYTLTVWCFRIPYLVRLFKTFRRENRYARRWAEDEGLRVTVSLWGALIWNTAYAVFQLCLGIYHRTFWYCSLAGYYFLLALMRTLLVLHTHRYKNTESMNKQLSKYRLCGWLFLTVNLSFSVIVYFMVRWNRGFLHDEITTITMAAYTFTSFTFAIVNIVKYKKYNSPIYSASKAISLAAACVSILTMESTMLTTFGGGGIDDFMRKLLLGASGTVISAFIVFMSVYMIINSTKKLKSLKEEEILNAK